MSNKLEKFVKDNKKGFEAKGPSDQLWARIATELDKQEQKKHPKKSIKLYQWMSIAAVALITVGVYFTYNNNKTTGPIEVAQIDAASGQKAVHFTSLIEERKDSLQVYAKENPELCNQFVSDLDKLGADYEGLKKQLQTSPNREFVVKAMMKNLELQLQVIDQQLTIVNQVNQYKKESSL